MKDQDDIEGRSSRSPHCRAAHGRAANGEATDGWQGANGWQGAAEWHAVMLPRRRANRKFIRVLRAVGEVSACLLTEGTLITQLV